MSRLAFVAVLAVMILAVKAAVGAPLPPGAALIAPPLDTPSDQLPDVTHAFGSGELNSLVVGGDPDNPFGGLTFYYTVIVPVGDTSEFGRLSIPGWAGLDIEAGHILGPETGPTVVWPASIDRQLNGDVVGINFLPLPGSPNTGFLLDDVRSTRIAFHTNATAFRQGQAFALGDQPYTFVSLVPVPEPSTIVLTLILSGAVAICRQSACRGFVQR